MCNIANILSLKSNIVKCTPLWCALKINLGICLSDKKLFILHMYFYFILLSLLTCFIMCKIVTAYSVPAIVCRPCSYSYNRRCIKGYNRRPIVVCNVRNMAHIEYVRGKVQ
jgi:hypothetical protein